MWYSDSLRTGNWMLLWKVNAITYLAGIKAAEGGRVVDESQMYSFSSVSPQERHQLQKQLIEHEMQLQGADLYHQSSQPR